MEFNVSQLMREPIGASRSYEIHEEAVRLSEADRPTRLDGTVRLLRTDRGILTSVRARLAIALRCSRCLEPISQPSEIVFEEEYLPTVEVLSGAPLQFAAAGDAFRIDEYHILGITEGLRQYRVASEPMAPLCRESCQGFCPGCGVDLNRASCSCMPATEERWNALGAL